MRFWHDVLETQFFRFDTFGATRTEAFSLMENMVTLHAKQRNMDPRQMWVTYRDDVVEHQREVGAAYRDNERFTV